MENPQALPYCVDRGLWTLSSLSKRRRQISDLKAAGAAAID